MKSVALIGRGAIGAVVIEHLKSGQVPGHRLAGVLDQMPGDDDVVLSLDALLARAPDLVVEAASQEAAKQYGLEILRAGTDLMLLSVGALADRDFERACHAAGQAGNSRLLVSSGAIGGLDALKSMARSGTLRSVRVHSHMHARAAVQPWMTKAQQESILQARDAVIAFEGTARQAATKFPRVANVSATVGLCSLGLDRVQVTLTASAAGEGKSHAIDAVSDVGELHVRVENRLSPDNPRTSALTPLAVIRYLHDSAAAIALGV